GLNRAVDRDLETIVLKCLEKNPDRRFGSATEVANELKRYLEGRPIRTRPLGPIGRSWRWCRRNPAVAVLSTAAVLLIAVAAGLLMAYRSTGRKLVEGAQREQEVVESKRNLDYLEDMPRALKLYNGSELGKAREILAKWSQPERGMIDHRGWEWYFLD